MKKLEGKRIFLRAFKESDLDDFYEYAKVEGVGERAGWKYHENKEVTARILKEFIEKEEVYAIVYRENNKVIGSVGMHDRNHDEDLKNKKQKEIGYVLSRDYWGKEIMREAVDLVLEYVFNDLKLDLVWCGHYFFNAQSKRVIEKCNFVFYKEVIFDTLSFGKIAGKCYILTRDNYFAEK